MFIDNRINWIAKELGCGRRNVNLIYTSAMFKFLKGWMREEGLFKSDQQVRELCRKEEIHFAVGSLIRMAITGE